MKNKLLSIILIAIMVLTVVPSVSFADEHDHDPSVDDIFGEQVESTVPSNAVDPSDPSDLGDPSDPGEPDQPTEQTTEPTTTTTTTTTTKHVHTYSVRTKKATCSKNGVKTYICSCGYFYSVEVPKLNHNRFQYVTTAATYFVQGAKSKTCILCGEVLSQIGFGKKALNKSCFKLSKGYKQFKVAYKKVSGAKGFQVRYKTSGKWVKKTYNSKKSVTKTIKVSSYGTYSVQVRVFKKVNGKKVYSVWTKSRKVSI